MKYPISIIFFVALIFQPLYLKSEVENDSLVVSRLEKLELHIDSINKLMEIENHKTNVHIDNIEDELTTNNNVSKIGAILLMFGLFLEIFGAVMISSGDLTGKTDRIMDTNIPLSPINSDFDTTNRLKENIIRFYGLLGIFLLGIGFVFQFIGTGLVIRIPKGYFAVLIVLVLYLAWRFAKHLMYRYKAEEESEENLEIFWLNLKRIMWHPVLSLMYTKKYTVCDICSRRVKANNVFVGFYGLENTTKEDREIPLDLAIGHKKCLEYNIPSTNWTPTVGKPRKTRIMEGEIFLKLHGPKYYNYPNIMKNEYFRKTFDRINSVLKNLKMKD